MDVHKLAPIIIAFQSLVLLLARGRLERHVIKKRLLGQKANRPVVLVCRTLGWLNVATVVTLGSWCVFQGWPKAGVNLNMLFMYIYALFISASVIGTAGDASQLSESTLSPARQALVELHLAQQRKRNSAGDKNLAQLALTFAVSFGGTMALMCWLLKHWHNPWLAVLTPVGWTIGLALPYLKLKRRLSHRIWLGLALAILAGLTVWTGTKAPPVQAVALWVLGGAGGLAMAFALIHAQARPKGDTRSWLCHLGPIWRFLLGREIPELKRCAEQGDAEAQLRLADRLVEGIGVDPDPAEAFRLALPLAERGNAEAQYLLWSLYLTGNGVPRNYAEAWKWCRLAANQGHADAVETMVEFGDPTESTTSTGSSNGTTGTYECQ